MSKPGDQMTFGAPSDAEVANIRTWLDIGDQPFVPDLLRDGVVGEVCATVDG